MTVTCSVYKLKFDLFVSRSKSAIQSKMKLHWFLFIRLPDIVCRQTYILPGILSSSYFAA